MSETEQAHATTQETGHTRGAMQELATSARVFTDIVCAVDGTRASMGAVRQAAALTGPGGHLTLLAVTAVTGGGRYTTAAISPARVEHVLEHAQSIAEELGVSCSEIVDPGSPPAEVILQRAAQHDLLAIGAPAGSWLGGMLVGSVAALALGHFTTPLLIARRSFTQSLHDRRVVVASDGRPGSDELIELAGRLGFATGARVTLLHAVDSESAGRPHAIDAQAQRLARQLPGAFDVRVEAQRPVEAILAAARNPEVALVLMGSRRLDGLRAFGSVSRKVAHEAACSVLLVPPSA